MLRRTFSIAVLSSLIVTLLLSDIAHIYGQEQEKKPRIAVLPFTDANTAAKREGYGEAIAAMLMTEIINGKVFQVLERSEIERVMKEMAFQISGRR